MNMIDEIGARILASLEESWEDNVFTLINTVYHPPSSADVIEYCSAIRYLKQRELVSFSWRILSPGDCPGLTESETSALLDSLEDWFVLGEDGNWTCGKGEIRTTVIPQLFIGEGGGAELAEKLVHDRGFEWWIHE